MATRAGPRGEVADGEILRLSARFASARAWHNFGKSTNGGGFVRDATRKTSGSGGHSEKEDLGGDAPRQEGWKKVGDGLRTSRNTS